MGPVTVARMASTMFVDVCGGVSDVADAEGEMGVGRGVSGKWFAAESAVIPWVMFGREERW